MCGAILRLGQGVIRGIYLGDPECPHTVFCRLPFSEVWDRVFWRNAIGGGKMLFYCWDTRYPHSVWPLSYHHISRPKGESWPKESQLEAVGSVPVLELGGKERLNSPSVIPQRLKAGCAWVVPDSRLWLRFWLFSRGDSATSLLQMVLCMSSLQKFKPAFFCLQHRGERTAGHLPSSGNRSEVIPWCVFSPQ